MNPIRFKLCFLAVLMFILIGLQFPYRALAATDTQGHWAEITINKALADGYANLQEDGTFKPNSVITGEEFLVMLAAALQLPVESSATDAAEKSGIYSKRYVNDLSKPLTRNEMALLIERATLQQAQVNMKDSSAKELSQAYVERYSQMESDYKLLLSLPGFPADVSLDDPVNSEEKILKWYIGMQEKFTEENEKQGLVYCSPAADEWYIKEYNCVNKNEERFYPNFNRFHTFYYNLTQVPKAIEGHVARYFSNIVQKKWYTKRFAAVS